MRALLLPSLFLLTLAACSPGSGTQEKPASTATALTAATAPATPNFDPPANAASVGPALAEAGSDLLLTWVEPTGSFATPVFQMRLSRFSGGRWSAPVTVAQGKDLFANWADFPGAVAVDPTGGEIVAHWLVKGADGYQAQVARSTDSGATWKPIGPLEADPRAGEHGFVSYAAEPGGVRAFWLEGSEGGSMSLRSRRIADGVSGPVELLDDRVCDCCQTGAVATPAGPVVVFRDRSEKEIRDVSALRHTAAGWAKPVAVHSDGWEIPGCPVNGPAVSVGGVGGVGGPGGNHLAVAWFTAAPPGPRVEVAFSEDGGATFGPAVEVAGGAAAPPVGRVDVRLDPAGAAIVSWVGPSGAASGAGEHAAIWLRRIGADGKAGTPFEVPDTRTVRASGFPRLGRSGDRLLLAWVDDTTASRLHASLVALSQVP